MARLGINRQRELEPKRIRFAVDLLESKGFEITYIDNTKIKFVYSDHPVTLYPYSGWHTGKSIKDGRGIENLLKQLV